MAIEGPVEAGLVEVEGVGVLHREFAHAQEPALRARLVAELRLELVPDLRKRLVRAQLRRVIGEDLLVGHAEGQVRELAVLQPEHLFTHALPAPRLLPDLLRMHAGKPELLGTDPIHLVADDLLDLAQRPEAERRQRIMPRHQLADQTSADQELVGDGLGVRRIVSQSRNESARPAHGISFEGDW